jgi:hypothetical protein
LTPSTITPSALPTDPFSKTALIVAKCFGFFGASRLIPTPGDHFLAPVVAVGCGHQWMSVLSRILSCWWVLAHDIVEIVNGLEVAIDEWLTRRPPPFCLLQSGRTSAGYLTCLGEGLALAD